jgi:hypothetical protein
LHIGTLKICGFTVLISQPTGGVRHEENLSAQEETESEGAWLPQENVYRQRQKSAEEKTPEGQSTSQLLSLFSTKRPCGVRQKTSDNSRRALSGFLLYIEKSR